MGATDVLEALVDRCRRDHHAWINGDASMYALPDDGSIMGAVGGFALGGEATSARQRDVARQWRRGEGHVEFVNGSVAGDVAWLALIERATVEFAAEPDGSSRRWDLRVTEVFRLIDGEWQRVHRHADPLVERRRLAEVADLTS